MASTPVGSNALILEVLNRNNYKDWRPRMNTYLLAEDLWEVVEAITEPAKLEDEYKTWTKKNAKALYAIQNSCGREMFSFIREIKTAKSAWEVLEQECKVVQGYDENNADHSERYISFTESVSSGDWDKAKECLGEVDARSVARAIDPRDDFGDIALHVAARKGHIHIVKELVVLMTQEDLKTKNAYGFTPLHIAVNEGHVQIVKELGPWMGEVKDCDGDTALHIAVKNEHLDIVKELVLLMSREDLKIKNDDGYTALHLAVNKGNMPIVKEFVTKEGENNITEDDFDRYIPFTDYVINGDWDNANERLRELDDPCGAITAVDPRDEWGDTGLHAAAREGHGHIVKQLLSLLKVRQEEDLELKTAQDLTAFGYGINLGVSEQVVMEKAKYMVEQYEKMLSSILDVQNAEGSTALHIAAGNGNVDIVKELVMLMRQEGLEIRDPNGATALHLAVSNGNVDIVKELVVPLMRKECLETKDADGNTALQIAVRNGNVDIVKELVPLMSKEGLEIKDADGDPPLQIAVRNGNMDIVKELIPFMRPEAMEEKDGEGYTALGRAVDFGEDENVREIAKYMAENNNKVFGIPTPPDNDIPVIWALRWSKWELARYLYSVTPLEVLNGPRGSRFICLCLDNSKEIDLAWGLLQSFPNLAFTVSEVSKTSPMLKLARMHYAFLSGTRLTRWHRWIYDRIHIREVAHVNIHDDISINVAVSEGDCGIKRDFISSVMSIFRRFVKGLHNLCGIQCMYEMKSIHKGIFEFLRCMGGATRNDNLTPDELDMVQKSIFKAIEHGHFEFVTHICKANPKLLDTFDEKGRTIFHFAIEYRQKEVYNLIYELEEKKRKEIGICLVNMDNNLLHYAANLSSLPQFDHIQDASLQMQRELQWFKEVKRVVPQEMHEHRNRSDDMTADELFTKNHKKLMDDAENSIKRTATSCTVVGALIVTIMFAVAFTVPGGNNGNTGFPLFLDQKLFKVFIVSDTISLAFSTTSVIIFLGILTSRYAKDDFLKSLPTKMMIGLVTLFLAITTMMIAFSCALIIMFDGDAWIVSLSILFASVPVISFVWFLFPLLVEILMSTYGHRILDKKVKL